MTRLPMISDQTFYEDVELATFPSSEDFGGTNHEHI